MLVIQSWHDSVVMTELFWVLIIQKISGGIVFGKGDRKKFKDL